MRIGIIGTGRITQRFVPEARTIEGVELTAIYNPRILSAKNYAKQQNIPYATDDIEAFLEQVDAVYVASPHHTHVEYCRQMLTAGKHVLCEKPMAMKEADVIELSTIAKEKNLVLMEAIKTAYCPGFKGILDLIRAGKIGEVVDVEAAFTKLTPSNLREYWDENGAGAFVELGTYSMLPILKVLGKKECNISYWSRNTVLGCDGYTKVMFDYGTATATAKAGIGAKSEGQLLITGTKGYILVPAPWWLTGCVEVHFENPNATEVYEYPFEEAGLRYEIQAFVEKIKVGTDCAKANGTSMVNDDCSTEAGVSLEDSAWLARQIENFLEWQKESLKNAVDLEIFYDAQEITNVSENKESSPRIWAHRGCSLAYPENTLEAFEAAAKLEGITGIELDVQLSWDGELVVIHDETVDRTTNRKGYVANYTLAELKQCEIVSVDDTITRIPTLREVFELLEPYCKEKGLLINIELKNSINRYPGMEQKTLALVEEFGLEEHIVYSSFLPESMGLIKRLNPNAQTGTLAGTLEKCLADAKEQQADALHPWNAGMELYDLSEYAGYPIRVWNGEEPFFGQDRILKEKQMTKYTRLGATDIITNVPELYLR